jgi:formylmethanofuran dehydrogenase subunit D
MNSPHVLNLRVFISSGGVDTVVVIKKENEVVFFSKETVDIIPTVEIVHVTINIDSDLVKFAMARGLSAMKYKGIPVALGDTCATLGIKRGEYIECVRDHK